MKPDYQIKNVKLYCCDNMEFMKGISDNFYDLAIVDPPYGINMGGGADWGTNTKTFHNKKNWDSEIPDKNYFIELIRVSKQQIIWGGNYFIEMLYNTKSFIVWNKMNGSNNMADCELAWTSFDKPVRMYSGHIFSGIGNSNYKSIHPTQKPIRLYKWILQNYAKEGDKIFDSHGGSFSSACACLDLGFDFDGCEIDKEYFDNAVNRLKNNVQEYIDFA